MSAHRPAINVFIGRACLRFHAGLIDRLVHHAEVTSKATPTGSATATSAACPRSRNNRRMNTQGVNFQLGRAGVRLHLPLTPSLVVWPAIRSASCWRQRELSREPVLAHPFPAQPPVSVLIHHVLVTVCHAGQLTDPGLLRPASGHTASVCARRMLPDAASARQRPSSAVPPAWNRGIRSAAARYAASSLGSRTWMFAGKVWT